MTPVPEAPPPRHQAPPRLRKAPKSPRMGVSRPLRRAIPLEGLLFNQTGTRPACDNSHRAGRALLKDPGGSSAGWRGEEQVHGQVSACRALM